MIAISTDICQRLNTFLLSAFYFKLISQRFTFPLSNLFAQIFTRVFRSSTPNYFSRRPSSKIRCLTKRRREENKKRIKKEKNRKIGWERGTRRISSPWRVGERFSFVHWRRTERSGKWSKLIKGGEKRGKVRRRAIHGGAQFRGPGSHRQSKRVEKHDVTHLLKRWRNNIPPGKGESRPFPYVQLQ